MNENSGPSTLHQYELTKAACANYLSPIVAALPFKKRTVFTARFPSTVSAPNLETTSVFDR